jgi:hypothetical protein
VFSFRVSGVGFTAFICAYLRASALENDEYCKIGPWL